MTKIEFRHTNFRRALKNLFSRPQKNVVVIEPNLGLGDSIIALGLVRELSAKTPIQNFIIAVYIIAINRFLGCFKI